MKFGTALALPVLCSLALRAAEPAPSLPGRTLTIDEALALAEQYNPRLKVATATVQVAEAGVVTAKARPNPVFTFGSLGRQQATLDTAVAGMLHGFTLTHPIELPTVRNTRIRSAQLGKTSSELAKAEMRLAVRGGVKQSFYEVLRRKGEVELSRTNLRLVEELRGRIETQVKVGEAARLELTRADAEVAAARIQLQSAELRRSVALASLYASIGASLGNADPQGKPDAPAILPPLETLRDEVMAQHPSIALAESEARRAGLQLDFQRAQKTPQPSVWADVLKQPDSSQYRFGVTVDLPVWNRREGPIAEAVASQRQAEALVGQRRVEISAALDRAYSLYQIAGQQVEMFEAGTLRQAEAALKAAEAAFRFGERSIIEVLDAQRVLRAARLDYLNAQYDRQQALIELEQLRALPGNGEKP